MIGKSAKGHILYKPPMLLKEWALHTSGWFNLQTPGEHQDEDATRITMMITKQLNSLNLSIISVLRNFYLTYTINLR